MDDFEQIFRTYSPVVHRFLLSLCGDVDLAQELTAETFYQAYLHIGKFRGDCKPETWLCQIAKHALYKEQKRRKRLVPQEERENTVPRSTFSRRCTAGSRPLHSTDSSTPCRSPIGRYSCCGYSVNSVSTRSPISVGKASPGPKSPSTGPKTNCWKNGRASHEHYL